MIRFLGFYGVRSPSFVSRKAELKRKTDDRDRTPLQHKRLTATKASKGWFTDGHERADGQFLANVKLVLKIIHDGLFKSYFKLRGKVYSTQ